MLVDDPGGLDKLAAERKVDDLFLTLLNRYSEQTQHVCHKPGSTYAPAIFARHPDAAGVTNKMLGAAMQRLLDANKIRIEEEGPKSHRRSRLVLV